MEKRTATHDTHSGLVDFLQSFYRTITSFELNWYWVLLILLVDSSLSYLIVKKIAYTEIDWRAYMEEVEGFLSGERDYTKIEGNTGPLVYPAGFLYIFAFFRSLTDEGTSIFKAQFLFVGIYIFNLLIVLWSYLRSRKVPLIWCFLLILSKRVHSIFMLRMFNDCVAMLFGYMAILCFTYKYWKVGSIVYSVAVSIKMNLFLFAPGIFLLYLLDIGVMGAVECISICAVVQIILGWPFLSTYPVAYLSKAFELSRVFMYKWTVNFKFLPEDIFVDKKLSLLLLLLTVLAYFAFGYRWISEINRACRSQIGEQQAQKISLLGSGKTTPNFICFTILTSNIIGIIFARSLHYQFYSWYFHSLPLLLFQTHIPAIVNIILIASIEICFNVYPATWWSSLLLQVCHLIILTGLLVSPVPYEEGVKLIRGAPHAKNQ